jgi:hypothetical protein
MAAIFRWTKRRMIRKNWSMMSANQWWSKLFLPFDGFQIDYVVDSVSCVLEIGLSTSNGYFFHLTNVLCTLTIYYMMVLVVKSEKLVIIIQVWVNVLDALNSDCKSLNSSTVITKNNTASSFHLLLTLKKPDNIIVMKEANRLILDFSTQAVRFDYLR